jgi:hypothetical protein
MPRKFDAGYSFRSAESLSQQDRRREPRRAQDIPRISDGEGMRPCSRGPWCASSHIISEGDGVRHEPALGPRSFCDRDRGNIARCLEELPEQYVRLLTEIGRPSMRGAAVRVPFGPRIPIRTDIEALMSLMAESLVSWHERVADIARLDFPSGAMSRMRREARAIGRAQQVLSAHLDALLSLPPLAMSRAWDLRALDDLPEGATGVVRSVFADITLDLSGTDAGLEILRIRYLARAMLGETRAAPEELVGVPCRDPGGTCGWRTIRRAELPSHEDEPAFWTECARCGDKMTEPEYREWTALCAAYERHRRKEPVTLENLPGVA